MTTNYHTFSTETANFKVTNIGAHCVYCGIHGSQHHTVLYLNTQDVEHLIDALMRAVADARREPVKGLVVVEGGNNGQPF